MFRYTPPPAELFSKNRKKFMERMAQGSVAVFFSNDLLPANGDGQYKFIQDSNFYYLTGIDQEECVLFLFPDAPKPELKEILYIRPTNETIQIWEGWKYSIDEAKAASGIATIRMFDEFESNFRGLCHFFETVYLAFNEHERNVLHYPAPAYRFAEKIRYEFPGHSVKRAYPILAQLRMVKEQEEIIQLQRAIDITDSAFRRVLKFIQPGVRENEIEAEILHEFIRSGASGTAYESIIATGANAVVLHYNRNCAVCQDGDVVLMDFGAEYGNYSADLSRSVPVSGKFTERQKAVYQAVLNVMKYAITLLVPGNNLEDYTTAVGLAMQEELLKLGLITEAEVRSASPDKPAYRKYFMHGVSHHLGLDTHDVNHRYVPFVPGMVFTCEPGIYIKEEGIGIRLENNLLITQAAPIDLMANIPIEVADIEAFMRK